MNRRQVAVAAVAGALALDINSYVRYSTIADEDYAQRNAGYVRMDCEYAIDMAYADQTDTEPCYVNPIHAR